jgi:putative ABC transport system permease protein
MMFKHYLRIALRTIRRQKLFSIINIAGLAVGLTTFILIALYIQYEYSFDTFHKNYKNIYRVEQIAHLADREDYWTSTVYPLGEAMQKTFPEIENSAVLRGVWGEYLASSEDLTFYEEDGLYAQNTIFEIFSFPFIAGDPENALDEPFSIVLTESAAEKYFPGENALGKIITAKNRFPFKVTGVIKDIPENSEFSEVNYISSISSIEPVEGWTLDNWGNYSFLTYLLVNPKSDNKQLENKIEYFLDEQKEDKSTSVTLWLLPLSKVHIDPDPDNKGFLAIIYMYSAVAIFALLIACINFVNLTTAYSSARAMEIGIKKVVGSDRLSLIFQFLTESVLFAVIATQLAFIIAEFSLPLFNRIVSRNLDIQYIENWEFILFILSISIISGLLAGIYPAFYLSRFKPVKVLKGSAGIAGRRNLFRKILVIFQFVISSMLILSTILLYRQFDFLKNKEMGFNKHNILYLTIDAGNKEGSRNFETIRTELLKNPISSMPPFQNQSPFSITPDRISTGKEMIRMKRST